MVRIYIGQDDLYGTETNKAYVCGRPQRIPQKRFGTPYLNMSDVEFMYFHLNDCSADGFTAFKAKAKEIAEFSGKRYMFKNESLLFMLLKERFASVFDKKDITSFGHLMQYFA